ncbi:MAG: hypothetical protein J6K73_10720 [Clostridia bacterium]|nr:hypothetical protein [Clostridia bacterium]
MTLWKSLFPWMQREASAGEEGQMADGRHLQAEQEDKPGAGMPSLSAVPPDLSRLASLAVPQEPDPFGENAPVLSVEAVRLSLALAEMTYTLDITPWMAAGWRDFSFQVDDVLESGVQPDSNIQTPDDAAFQQLASLHRMRRAQAALRARNPIGQMLAALRQRESSDTVKAVCMAHPLPDGRELIAIGFMGTGKRFYDWFSNFRFADEAGFHRGFSQLCSHFEAAAEQIVFPVTAARLGMSRLSLRKILEEMRSPDSRFHLWMAGHSQGGAVMQVFTHRLLQAGVLAQHICGYGFASPTTASAALTSRPWAYPLWHIQNRDDLVPRIGAQTHLGRCAEFEPTAAFRERAYQYSALPADEACRAWMEPMIFRIRDTADNLLHVTALMLCAAEEKGEDALNLLMDRGRSLMVLDWLYAFAGDQAQNVVQQLEQHQRRMYRDLTGQDMDACRLRALKEELRPYVAATPLRRMVTTLVACLTQPHLINEDDPAIPKAYALLVRQGLGSLRPFRWELRGGQMVKRYASALKKAGAANRRTALHRGKARLGARQKH